LAMLPRCLINFLRPAETFRDIRKSRLVLRDIIPFGVNNAVVDLQQIEERRQQLRLR